MLSVRPKINELLLRLYSRSLHPELLEIQAAKYIERSAYCLHLSITTTGHLIRLEPRRQPPPVEPGNQLVEVLTSAHHELPAAELVRQPVRGHVDQTSREVAGVHYRCQVQLEQVAVSQLFSCNQSVSKMAAAGSDEYRLLHQFESNGRIDMGAISLLVVEARLSSVRIQGIHTFPDTGQLLTSQTTFKIENQAEDKS